MQRQGRWRHEWPSFSCGPAGSHSFANGTSPLPHTPAPTSMDFFSPPLPLAASSPTDLHVRPSNVHITSVSRNPRPAEAQKSRKKLGGIITQARIPERVERNDKHFFFSSFLSEDAVVRLRARGVFWGASGGCAPWTFQRARVANKNNRHFCVLQSADGSGQPLMCLWLSYCGVSCTMGVAQGTGGTRSVIYQRQGSGQKKKMPFPGGVGRSLSSFLGSIGR